MCTKCIDDEDGMNDDEENEEIHYEQSQFIRYPRWVNDTRLLPFQIDINTWDGQSSQEE